MQPISPGRAAAAEVKVGESQTVRFLFSLSESLANFVDALFSLQNLQKCVERASKLLVHWALPLYKYPRTLLADCDRLCQYY
jgi:hypothetical protein